MEGVTCVKVNESRSEFADKEEGKKYGIISEIGGSCPDDNLGIRRPRKVAKTVKRQ